MLLNNITPTISNVNNYIGFIWKGGGWGNDFFFLTGIQSPTISGTRRNIFRDILTCPSDFLLHVVSRAARTGKRQKHGGHGCISGLYCVQGYAFL